SYFKEIFEMSTTTGSEVVHKNGNGNAGYSNRKWTLGVLSIALIIIGLDITVLNVAIPTLQKELNASASGLQWIINSYILVFAGVLLTMGTLGDRFGRRLAFQAGLVIFGLASVGAAFADSTSQLIIARAAQGIGGALIMPSTLSVIVDVFPREERAKAIGIWAGVAAIGIPGGMIAGGWLLENFFWGSVFLLNVPVVIVALLGSFVVIPESRDPNAKTIDWVGASFSMVSLSALIYAIIEAPEKGWLSGVTLAGFAIFAVFAALFVWYEQRQEHPMVDLKLFKNARLSAAVGSIGIAFMAMLGMMFMLTQYLQFVQGYSPLDTGFRLVPMAMGFMVGAPTSAFLVGRLNSRTVMTVGMFLVAASVGSMALLDVETTFWITGSLIFAMGLGMANVMAPATDAVMAAVPESHAGVGSALNDTVRQIGGALGVGIFGSILSSIYTTNMSDAVSGLPQGLADAASNQIGAALQVADSLEGSAGGELVVAAKNAFIDGTSIVYVIAGVVALIGTVLVWRFMPKYDLVAGSAEAEREIAASTGATGTAELATATVAIDE
ncbi:MAG: DHA2 family efflux MFS transporter permease subunit, partial [Chloroflexi bacterium]|nr:DHA2 family efflux MFS transporter permease subunit [Chloroflexota bacterium]